MMIVTGEEYLSENLAFYEMVRSLTGDQLGIVNTPTAQDLLYSSALCHLVVQPLRDTINIPINPTSWYRSPALNAAIPGASRTSYHMTGAAMDIQVQGMAPRELSDVCRKLELPYDKLIIEGFETATGWVEWLHIQIPAEFKAKPRRERWKATGERSAPDYGRID